MRLTYAQRRSVTRLIRALGIIFFIGTALDVLRIHLALNSIAHEEPQPFKGERIFISSILWTDEWILRDHWVRAVTDLAKAIGKDNVYVSVEESGSLDDTKGVLSWLEYELQEAGIRRSIMLDYTTREDVVSATPSDKGWITMPFDKPVPASPTTWATIAKGQPVPRRIPYLASLRNKALRPLFEMAERGEYFDKILFLNDVVFTTEDVQRLLATRGGDYATACALDFKHSSRVYDTFALRDSHGYEPVSEQWPYFRGAESRSALRHGQPVPVSSCWNGMLFMDTEPFYNAQTKLRFRGISDSLGTYHLEGSESCLIHTDNPLSHTKGVWINPNVRVAYSGPAYDAVNPPHSRHWLSALSIAVGTWQNRIVRWTSTSWFADRQRSQRLTTWRRNFPTERETGEVCLIDETQILIFNGWAHI